MVAAAKADTETGLPIAQIFLISFGEFAGDLCQLGEVLENSFGQCRGELDWQSTQRRLLAQVHKCHSKQRNPINRRRSNPRRNIE